MFKNSLIDQLNSLANPVGANIANQVLTGGIANALAIQKSQFALMGVLATQFTLKNHLNHDFLKNAIGISAGFHDEAKNLNSIYHHLGLSQFDVMMNGISKSLKIQNTIMQGIVPKVHQLQLGYLDSLAGLNKLNDLAKPLTSISIPKSMSTLLTLEQSLFGLSYRITKDALSSQRYKTLDDFEEVSTHAGTIKERIIEQQVVTKDDLMELRTLFLETSEKLGRKIDGKDKNLSGKILQYIMIIAFILDLISNIVNVYHLGNAQINPEQPTEILTQKDLDIFKIELMDTLTNLAPQEKSQSRYARVNVNLRTKPRIRSAIMDVLPQGHEVILLDSCRKWAYVSTRDSSDTYVIHGWVFKKYLVKNVMK